MRRAVMTAAAVLGGLLGMVQAGYWCECFCAALDNYLVKGRRTK